MRRMKRWRVLLTGLILAAAGMADNIIYKDTFSGSAASLSGRVPEESSVSRAKWISRPEMVTDGNAVTPNTLPGKCAALPFEPQKGKIYRVSADLTISGGKYIALGFLSNNSKPAGNEYFWELVDTSSPWLALAAAGHINTFSGPTTKGYEQFLNQGTHGHLAITLDTTQKNWTATYYFNGNELRKVAYPDALEISYVGFGVDPISEVSVDNFVLEILPELGKE